MKMESFSPLNVRDIISIFEQSSVHRESHEGFYPLKPSKSHSSLTSTSLKKFFPLQLSYPQEQLQKLKKNLSEYNIYCKYKHVQFQDKLMKILAEIVSAENDELDPKKKKELIHLIQGYFKKLNDMLPDDENELPEKSRLMKIIKQNQLNSYRSDVDLRKSTLEESKSKSDLERTKSVKNLKDFFEQKSNNTQTGLSNAVSNESLNVFIGQKTCSKYIPYSKAKEDFEHSPDYKYRVKLSQMKRGILHSTGFRRTYSGSSDIETKDVKSTIIDHNSADVETKDVKSIIIDHSSTDVETKNVKSTIIDHSSTEDDEFIHVKDRIRQFESLPRENGVSESSSSSMSSTDTQIYVPSKNEVLILEVGNCGTLNETSDDFDEVEEVVDDLEPVSRRIQEYEKLARANSHEEVILITPIFRECESGDILENVEDVDESRIVDKIKRYEALSDDNMGDNFDSFQSAIQSSGSEYNSISTDEFNSINHSANEESDELENHYDKSQSILANYIKDIKD